jgi:Ca2+-binding EF-hand superfamily protein
LSGPLCEDQLIRTPRTIAAALGLAAIAWASAGVADPPAPTAAPPLPPRVFLSPSGEPFRLSKELPDPLKAWFDQADANHDGAIDKAEFRADATRFFKRLDANNDGMVDGFEVSDYESKIVPELAQMAEGRLPGQFGPARGGEHGGSEHGGGSRDGAGSAPRGQRQSPQRLIAQLIAEPEPISGADFDFDSHITLAEWMRATDQRFEILDAAKTGRLTLDEMRTRLNPPRKR